MQRYKATWPTCQPICHDAGTRRILFSDELAGIAIGRGNQGHVPTYPRLRSAFATSLGLFCWQEEDIEIVAKDLIWPDKLVARVRKLKVIEFQHYPRSPLWFLIPGNTTIILTSRLQLVLLCLECTLNNVRRSPEHTSKLRGLHLPDSYLYKSKLSHLRPLPVFEY